MPLQPIRRGDLVEILPHLGTSGPSIWVLCLPGRQRVPKIRAFVNFAVEALGAEARS